MTPTSGWTEYLATFHAERAGITEDVLDHACDEQGRSPYQWLAAAVPGAVGGPVATSPRVLDLACGSAPMSALLLTSTPGSCYVGADLSIAELRRARRRQVFVVQADAGRLPLPDASVDVVVMSMALMLVPLAATLSEVRRVLRPGGLFAATVPHHRPLPRSDWWRYARLCLALRHPGLRYPNDAVLSDARAAFEAAGLTLRDDVPGAFFCRLETEEIAEQLLASLYLPDVHPDRMRAGERVVHGWVGTSITTPIRLLTATAPTV